jgi:hypothetical protein
MMHIHKPDGYLPQLSDTDRKSYLSYLEEGAQLFGRQDMLYAATKGAQGIPPQKTFAPFPTGGVFVMRSDWGSNRTNYQNTKYLVFDMSSNEPSHAHSDILTFEAYVNGNLLVRDAGRYTYTVGSWRDYFRGTAGHNTLVVDGKDQKVATSGTAEYWSSSPGYDYVVGSHQAYSGLKVQRSVFFAKPEYWIISDLVTGTGQHTYDVFYHIDPMYRGTVSFDSITRAVTTPHFGLFPSDSSVETQVISGWVSDSYNVKTEAPIVKQKKTGSPPVAFASVLFPFASSKTAITASQQDVLNGSNIVDISQAMSLKVKKAEKEDWFFRSNLTGAVLQYGPFRTDARAAFVGLSADSAVLNLQIVDGSLMYYRGVLLCETKGGIASISWHQKSVYVQSGNLQYAMIFAPGIDSLYLNGSSVHVARIGEYLVYGIATAVAEQAVPGSTRGDFRLEQNYPNPFNPTTTIRFAIASRCQVILKVYDLLGRELATLINESLDAGSHTTTWNAQRFASGTYIYRLRAGEYEEARSLMLLR